MATATADAVSAIELSQGEIVRLAERLNQSVGQVQTIWENYRVRFEAVDQDLERAFQHLSDNVGNNVRVAEDFVSKLDASFKSALQHLASGIDGIRDSTDEISSSLAQFARAGSTRREGQPAAE
jgi:methyl-accepting chemotaxis protein